MEAVARKQKTNQKRKENHSLIMQVAVIEPASGPQGRAKEGRQEVGNSEQKGNWLGPGAEMRARQQESKIFKYRQTIKHEPAKADAKFFSMVPRSRVPQRSIDNSGDFVHQIVRNNSHSLGKQNPRREGGK